MDENRELRAMLLSVLHLPPLPVTVNLVEREDNSVINDDHTETSHIIICNLVEWMAVMDSNGLNKQRMMQQMELQQRFQTELRTLPADATDEDLYAFYCLHTRLWINSYTPLGDTIRFKPISTICCGDKAHAALLDYAKAQYHYFKDGNETLDISDTLSCSEILRKCAEWSREWNADNTPIDAQCLFEQNPAADARSEPPVRGLEQPMACGVSYEAARAAACAGACEVVD
jgi:hypothetical protein